MKDNQIEFAFCLETLYPEQSFVGRIEAVRELGVRQIEFWDYRDKDLDALQKVLADKDMGVTNFSGNRACNMVLEAEREAFLQEIQASVLIAKRLACPRLMVLAQPLCDDGSAQALPAAMSQTDLIGGMVQGGRELGILADRVDLDFVIEPLNTLVDHPGYFLNSSRLAFQCISEISHPRVTLLYDIYHMATMGEPVLQDIENHLDKIGYIHVADVPGRHEPGTGGLGYREIFKLLRTRAFQGTVGFEFFPSQVGSSEAVKRAMEVFQ